MTNHIDAKLSNDNKTLQNGANPKEDTEVKKSIRPDSPAKDEQRRFIDEGGNSQVLNDDK